MKHVLLETSFIVRFLTRDAEDQFQESYEVFSAIEDGLAVGFVSLLTIQELLWILEYTYFIPREEFVTQLTKLFSIKNIKIIECKKQTLLVTLQTFASTNLDFAACYLLEVKGGKEIATFDKKILKILE